MQAGNKLGRDLAGLDACSGAYDAPGALATAALRRDFCFSPSCMEATRHLCYQDRQMQVQPWSPVPAHSGHVWGCRPG